MQNLVCLSMYRHTPPPPPSPHHTHTPQEHTDCTKFTHNLKQAADRDLRQTKTATQNGKHDRSIVCHYAESSTSDELEVFYHNAYPPLPHPPPPIAVLCSGQWWDCLRWRHSKWWRKPKRKFCRRSSVSKDRLTPRSSSPPRQGRTSRTMLSTRLWRGSPRLEKSSLWGLYTPFALCFLVCFCLAVSHALSLFLCVFLSWQNDWDLLCHPAWSHIHGAWLYGGRRTCRDSSSFMWHQPRNNQTVLWVHHFGGYSKKAPWKACHSFRIACDMSTVSLPESEKQRYIKATNFNNCSNTWVEWKAK